MFCKSNNLTKTVGGTIRPIFWYQETAFTGFNNVHFNNLLTWILLISYTLCQCIEVLCYSLQNKILPEMSVYFSYHGIGVFLLVLVYLWLTIIKFLFFDLRNIKVRVGRFNLSSVFYNYSKALHKYYTKSLFPKWDLENLKKRFLWYHFLSF